MSKRGNNFDSSNSRGPTYSLTRLSDLHVLELNVWLSLRMLCLAAHQAHICLTQCLTEPKDRSDSSPNPYMLGISLTACHTYICLGSVLD
jgi:hypothetical protein